MVRKLLLIWVVVFLLSSVPIMAVNDLTVVCPANNKKCRLIENLVLFDDKNIAPGYISSPRKITIINKNPKEECLLAMQAVNISGSPQLAGEVTLSMADTSHVWYAGSLSDLGLGADKPLGVIPPKKQNSYQLTASLNQNLGNEYQGLTTGFDLNLNFTCQLPTPTASESNSADANAASHTLVESNQSVVHDMVLGISIENTVCNERVPQPPILMTTIPGENSVTLKWIESNDPLTYYLVAYGTDPKRYEFGNPNIGGVGTNEYTVVGLSADTTYYFAIRAGNGCASGEFSNQLPGTPNGKVLTKEAAVGFLEDILGTNNQDNSIPPTVYASQGKVLGANNQKDKLKLLIIPPTLVYLLAAFYRKPVINN